ncbi:MAG: RES family NAD+ phosphorylase [Burkholderiales bacterium]|nr:RES family NAD+ phosphorylase [Burkholderiales bacterium]
MSFKTWHSYWKFRTAVATRSRYIFDKETEDFLAEVIKTSKSRQMTIHKDEILWRAQLGSGTRPIADENGNEFEDLCPLPSNRMKPLKFAAREGRVNTKGIPCLYLATSKETAMSEVRPWVGSEISVAQFKIKKELTVINCSMNVLESDPLFYNAVDQEFYEPSEEEKEKSVWTHLDKAFSEPVTQNDDQAHYAPTQIIAELFKKNGLDGVLYKSMLADDYNVALFDPEVAEMLNCSLYKASRVTFSFEQTANPYFIKSNQKSGCKV